MYNILYTIYHIIHHMEHMIYNILNRQTDTPLGTKCDQLIRGSAVWAQPLRKDFQAFATKKVANGHHSSKPKWAYIHVGVKTASRQF